MELVKIARSFSLDVSARGDLEPLVKALGHVQTELRADVQSLARPGGQQQCTMQATRCLLKCMEDAVPQIIDRLVSIATICVQHKRHTHRVTLL